MSEIKDIEKRLALELEELEALKSELSKETGLKKITSASFQEYIDRLTKEVEESNVKYKKGLERLITDFPEFFGDEV